MNVTKLDQTLTSALAVSKKDMQLQIHALS